MCLEFLCMIEYGVHWRTKVTEKAEKYTSWGRAFWGVFVQLYTSADKMRWTHLDGRLWEVELSRQLAAARARHIVLFEELLLQPGELLPRERRPVPPGHNVIKSLQM